MKWKAAVPLGSKWWSDEERHQSARFIIITAICPSPGGQDEHDNQRQGLKTDI